MASLLRQIPRQSWLAPFNRAFKQALQQKQTKPNLLGVGFKQRSIPATQALTRSFHTSPISHDVEVDKTTTTANESIPPPREIYQYTEKIKGMTNEELNDPSTIPGFLTLIHSPPLNRASTPRNALVGKVVSDKMNKTVNVEVDRYKIHPKYRKRLKYSKKFMAHDEEEVCKEGDLVMIIPCQRISRKKHFRVHEIIKSKGGVL